MKLGTAHFDIGRCLPYSKNVPCVVCEEVCPTSPKAIYTERRLCEVREGKKMALSSADNTVTVSAWPKPGRSVGEPVLFRTGQWRGDETTAYYITVQHRDGTEETHRVTTNDADTLMIERRFSQAPARGEVVVLQIELKLPKIDTRLCIGCGICERECPVVGDRRAVYVTAEGETRSDEYYQRDRNRSLRLIKSASAQGSGADRGHHVDLRRFLT